MKQKFFINVLSLLIFVICLFSFIWPKISEVWETRGKQSVLREKMAVLDEKTAKIESLSRELESNLENQELVLKYIPSTRSDEFLINYLNSIAHAEGLSLSDIAIEEKKSELLAEVSAPTINSEIGLDLSRGRSEASLATAVSPQPVFETASFNLFASYEKIAALLNKFDGLKRFNEIVSLKIIKTYPNDNKEDASLNFLQIELGLDFNHLKKISSQAEIDENLFSRESFDQETLTKIRNKAINDARDPDGKTDGRNNPFIP